MSLPSHSDPDRTGRSLFRIAVLWDLNRPGATVPVGVALEYADEITISLPSGYAFPSYYREPIQASTPTMDRWEWEPGYPEYFEHVLADIQRSFAVTLVPVQ